MKYVVLGAGPTGLSVLQELLNYGIDPNAIFLVDESFFSWNSSRPSPLSQKRESIFEIVSRESLNKGVGKAGNDLDPRSIRISKPSKIWGTSCLPPLNWELSSPSVSQSEFVQAYNDVSIDWEIQAVDSFESDFPISGEVIGELPRKEMSYKLSKSQEIIHSRLAISTRTSKYSIGCTLNSTCFSNCPNDSPWNPENALRKILDLFPGVNLIEGKVIKLDNRLKVIHTNQETVKYDFLYISLGAMATRNLISQFFVEPLALDTTPVVIAPFFLRKKVLHGDYTNSFLYCDLLIPHKKRNQLMAISQIYLPSREITGRIIATLPPAFHKLLAKLSEPLLAFIFKRIGVCMMFFSSMPLGESGMDKDLLKNELIFINSILKFSGARVLNFRTTRLLNGSSHHIGAIHFEKENLAGIDSPIFSRLAEMNIFLTDTSALPALLPGPHTAIAAALAKISVKNSLKL
jgi:hypothetical protein